MKNSILMRDYVRRCSVTYPKKTAYIDGDRRHTWLEVRDRSVRLAHALVSLGVKKGDCVAMLSNDHIEAVEHIFACMEIGAVRVGINRGYAPREMAHVVHDCDARVVIIQNSCESCLNDYIADFERDGRQIIGFGKGHTARLDYETLLMEKDGDFERPPLGDEDPAAISYTSGTTGLPKGVIFKQGGMRDMLVHFVLSVGLRHEDVWLNPTSMAWATMMLNVMSIVNGMTTVLHGGDFKAERFLDLCSRNRVTSVVVVPVMLQRLLVALKVEKGLYDLSALRLVSYGSAPAAPPLIRDAINTLGVELVQLYGLTECCAWATYLPHADHLRALEGNPELLKSCGKPGVYCDISMRDENGKEVGPGEPGELWIRSSTTMAGYKNLPELTAATLQGDWLRTHDLGRVDAEGYLYLTDRKNFLIITGAANVYPSLVEGTIMGHPGVQEVAVVGVPHPEWGEAVVAMVALKKGFEVPVAEIIQFCQGKVAKWEVPKFVEIVEEIPKGPTLKVLKKQIKERYHANPAMFPW